MNATQTLFLIGAIATGLVIWSVLRARARAKRAISDVQRRYLVVLLRSSPAEISEDRLESAASRAWSERFGANENEAPFVDSSIGEDVFILHAHGNALAVTSARREDRHLTVPQQFQDEESAGLWNRHSHDLSVGVAYNVDAHPRKLAAYVGKLAAALSDENTLALFHPQTQRLWKLDETTLARLQTDPSPFFVEEAGTKESR